MAETAVVPAPTKAPVAPKTRAPYSGAARFRVTMVFFLAIVLTHFIAQQLGKSPSRGVRLFGSAVIAFAVFFAFVWMRVHSFALSRRRRAFFDEVNILETYQPRARTMGHLFQPDPPTPGPKVTIADPNNSEIHTDAEKAAFNANRDAHYANMFEQAMRLNREMDAAMKADSKQLESSQSDSKKSEPSQSDRKKSEPSQTETKQSAPSKSEGSQEPTVPKGVTPQPQSEDSTAREGPRNPSSEAIQKTQPENSEVEKKSRKVVVQSKKGGQQTQPGGKNEDNKTDLSTIGLDKAPAVDDNTLRNISEIKSLNLLPTLEVPKQKSTKSPRKKRSKANVKSPKSSGRQK
ncbi:hypothetical protein QR680_017821 [Steinernema hermaphroditum]|uniref:Uncharacterized protein n=1 Tax=Steinernema hermaphroditum TaxID=289476 RepID=A0AA39HFY7_9BILA|nr:hypothetical protein QR680_017821 [Steinernema hermaphroditum]